MLRLQFCEHELKPVGVMYSKKNRHLCIVQDKSPHITTCMTIGYLCMIRLKITLMLKIIFRYVIKKSRFYGVFFVLFFIFDVFSTYTELNPEPIIDTTIKFTLITKRGNKQQVSV